MIALYILFLFTFITVAGFCVAIMDVACEAHENWQKDVTAEDLKQLEKFIRE